jgi:hypothetical protein
VPPRAGEALSPIHRNPNHVIHIPILWKLSAPVSCWVSSIEKSRVYRKCIVCPWVLCDLEERLRQWITDLDSDQFAIREEATA